VGRTEQFKFPSKLYYGLFSIKFEGYLKVEKDGLHGFVFESDEPAEFYLDNILVIKNDGVNWRDNCRLVSKDNKRIVEKQIDLKKGFHKIVVTYTDMDKMCNPQFKLMFTEPESSQVSIPKERLYISNHDIASIDNFQKEKSLNTPSIFLPLNGQKFHLLSDSNIQFVVNPYTLENNGYGCLEGVYDKFRYAYPYEENDFIFEPSGENDNFYKIKHVKSGTYLTNELCDVSETSSNGSTIHHYGLKTVLGISSSSPVAKWLIIETSPGNYSIQ
jgi:hypothetical protein